MKLEAEALVQRPVCGEIRFRGEQFFCDHHGALFWPRENCLIVSDLHLEKGAAFAARGTMLPPYDTLATLQILARCIEYWQPQTVISLGDSFHRNDSAENLPVAYRLRLNNMIGSRNWVWISGNHDPGTPASFAGICKDELSLDPVHFRHEQAGENSPGEISGHLHPKAVFHRRGKRLRRRCFISDGQRLIMPAFGVFTGGLNIRSEVFCELLDVQKLQIWMLGRNQVFEIPAHHLS